MQLVRGCSRCCSNGLCVGGGLAWPSRRLWAWIESSETGGRQIRCFLLPSFGGWTCPSLAVCHAGCQRRRKLGVIVESVCRSYRISAAGPCGAASLAESCHIQASVTPCLQPSAQHKLDTRFNPDVPRSGCSSCLPSCILGHRVGEESHLHPAPSWLRWLWPDHHLGRLLLHSQVGPSSSDRPMHRWQPPWASESPSCLPAGQQPFR